MSSVPRTNRARASAGDTLATTAVGWTRPRSAKARSSTRASSSSTVRPASETTTKGFGATATGTPSTSTSPLAESPAETTEPLDVAAAAQPPSASP